LRIARIILKLLYLFGTERTENDGRSFIKSEVIVSNYERESANLWTYESISPLWIIYRWG